MKRAKRFILYTLILGMFLSSVLPITVYAEEYEPIDTRNPDELENTSEADLKRVHSMEVQSDGWTNWPKGPTTNGEAAIVMDASNGAILYAKNIDGYAYPASITKILTTLVALENANLTDTVTATQDSLSCLGNGYANIGFKAGEEVSLEDALYAVLLASANEVSHAVGSSVGVGVGEDYDWFIARMNSRAKELGAVNSNFVNTNGVHDDDHYTTAHDMALITQELLNHHPEFEQIAQTLQYTIGKTNLTNESRTFQQVHKMFYEGNEHFDSRVIAGKTGYTIPARNTLVTCTDDGNRKLIVVVLKTYGKNVYDDTEALIDYGYENFEKINITKDDVTEEITGIVDGSYVVVPKGVTLSDLKTEIISEEDGSGRLEYTYQGQSVGSFEVTLPVTEKKSEENTKKSGGLSIIKVLAFVFIVVVLGCAFLLIILLIYREKRRKERKRMRDAKRQRYLREQELRIRKEARREEKRRNRDHSK